MGRLFFDQVDDGGGRAFPNPGHSELINVDTTTFYNDRRFSALPLTFDTDTDQWGGQKKDAVGEDSEATVASVLYQLALRLRLGTTRMFFVLMSEGTRPTLEQFFAADAPSIARPHRSVRCL